jgi:16S rRNA (cytidine1402-2'-O)-methyltransferase
MLSWEHLRRFYIGNVIFAFHQGAPMNTPHCLYIVSTPIGNLEDITLRALRILKEVRLILAEDTRHTKHLLDHFEIRTPMKSYHDFNKEKVSQSYLDFIINEGSVALVSDAGTPGLADPGFNIVRDAIKRNISVVPIPGASALLSALIPSGLPTDRFRFENFAPKKSAQRIRLLESLRECDQTIVLYASPHNLQKFLGEFHQVYSDTVTLVLARELTKKFEEFLRGKPSELLLYYKERQPRGEYVLLFHPQNKGQQSVED